MEAVVGPVLEIVKCLGAPLLRRIGYVKNLKKNFIKLNTKAEMMYAMRRDKQTEVDGCSPGKVRSSQFEAWVKEVERIENQTNAIEEDFKQEKKCFRGFCPDICLCMRLGKDIVDLIDRISDLKKFDGPIMIDAPPGTVEEILVPRIGGRTSTNTLWKVMGFIKDSGIKKIGIWGMGGVGKTTLMQSINNLPDITQMFDIVIWVTVSRDWSLRMVQNEVAQRLSLSLSDGMSDDGVSRRLYDRLRNSKYLLLLDDVWEKLNLVQVGIPIPNEENGCKILLTTRDRQICRKMETDKQISVEVLSEEQAWKLFREKVGSVVDSPEIHPLARGVVQECGGLPLAIIVVGGALREEGDVHVWRNALRELSSAVTSQIKDLEQEVYKRLRFSYDRLKLDRQRCFLYGALYPEDAEISVPELIEYWRAAGFLEDDGTVKSLAEAVDAGHAILKDLVDASLLERCRVDAFRREYVKMHDVIRDLALRITSIEAGGGNSNKYKFLVRAGKGIQTPPEEQWKEYNVVSLMKNKLKRLPELAVCPSLSTLLLQRNHYLPDIPESFFEAMPTLQVLDLSYTSVRSLPPSICNLVHLRGMYLNSCPNLVELPPEIGALKALEVLMIVGINTGIRGLPIMVGELTRLKCLHVFFSRSGGDGEMMIPQGIVSRLSLLEDLRIEVSEYESLGRDWDRNLEDGVMEEVCNLTELTRLHFWFTRVGYLKCFIDKSGPWHNRKLSSFTFNVGPNPRFHISVNSPVSRILQFEGGDGAPPQAIKQVLCCAESFCLEEHSSIKNMLGEFGMENMTHLKYLQVYACPGIESLLIDSNCSFPNLEELHIFFLTNLRDIWGDQLAGMVNLRELKLYNCDRLQKVLPRSGSIIQLLPNLEELIVYACKEMKEIIEGEGGAESINNALPKLKTLELRYLPNLEIICKQVMAWPSIEYIYIDSCHNMRRLPFGINNKMSTLKKIECGRAWWDTLQWEDDEIKTQLQPFASFS